MKEDANDFNDDIVIKRFAIYKSGISDIQASKLSKKFPTFPNQYKESLLQYNIFDVDVGYFDLTPVSYDVDNIVDSLIMAQDPEHSFLPRKILDPLDLYWIGNNNNDTVYVAGKNSPYSEDEIIAIHEFILDAEEKDYDRYKLLLAKNFEQFLIIAGNLNEVHRENIEDGEKRIKEMESRLNLLNVDQKYHESWFEYL